MIKFTPFCPKGGRLFLAFLSMVILITVSCKKEILTASGEIPDPELVKRNIAYAKGPKLKTINLNEFKKQVNVESLGTLTKSFRDHSAKQGKLMSVNTEETFKGFSIQTDSIKVIETDASVSYVFPVKLSSARAISFQNLTIQKYKANGSTIAFINTYTPTGKWISEWKKGHYKKFDGKMATTFLNIGNDELPIGAISSKRAGSNAKTMEGIGGPVCPIITLYWFDEYICAAREHWPGDNRCTLEGWDRAGINMSYISFEDCTGVGGPGFGGGDDGGINPPPNPGGGGVYNPYPYPGGGGGSYPGGGSGGGGNDPGTGGGGSDNGGGTGGGGTGGGTGPGTIPTPPGDYDPCIGTDPGMGGLNVVSGATGAKLMISQPVDCDPSIPPIIPPDPSDPDLNYDPFASVNIPSRYSGVVHPETGQWVTYGQLEDYFEANPDVAEALVAMDLPSLQIQVFPTFIGSLAADMMQEASYLKIIHPEWSNIRIGAVASWNVMNGKIHFALDLAGMVPVIGEAADFVNGAIYYLEGDHLNAALSVAAAVPVYGWVSTGGKWVRTVGKMAPKALSEAAGKAGYIAIKSARGTVRFIKIAVSNFSHGAITALKAVKPADNTLTNLSRTMLDQLSLRIKPAAQNLKSKVDDIILNGDAAGTKTEQLCDAMFETNGFIKHEAKIGSNNGLDGVFIKKDASGNVQEIIINEAKQVGNAGNIKLSGANLSTNLKAQMSDGWITDAINNLKQQTGDLGALGNLLQANRSKITKTVTGVDKSSGEIIVLKLGSY